MKSYPIDERRRLVVPGSTGVTLHYAVNHFIECAQKAIQAHSRFNVALSGGSTPKAIFQGLSNSENRKKIDWTKVFLFWSDERAVPPDHPDSNYRMAMEEGGLGTLNIPKNQIFRMEAENNIEEKAKAYEDLLRIHLKEHFFDLVMLGIGEDGHTASLFPHSTGLFALNRLVIPNIIPEKKSFRMTLTFEAINQSQNIVLYVLGEKKKDILFTILAGNYNPDLYPSMRIGTQYHPALFVADIEASQKIVSSLKNANLKY